MCQWTWFGFACLLACLFCLNRHDFAALSVYELEPHLVLFCCLFIQMAAVILEVFSGRHSKVKKSKWRASNPMICFFLTNPTPWEWLCPPVRGFTVVIMLSANLVAILCSGQIISVYIIYYHPIIYNQLSWPVIAIPAAFSLPWWNWTWSLIPNP